MKKKNPPGKILKTLKENFKWKIKRICNKRSESEIKKKKKNTDCI